ncbi:MAG: dATP/dGTP diphosphohydrolase domain-containing protein [Elusimicrobiales bacterium]
MTGPLSRTQGHKADAGKPRLELLPGDALAEVAKVLTLGAKKYGDRNWERGIAYSRVFGAHQRHALSWFARETRDPETGLSHIAHCAANALFLLSYELRNRRELDDRPQGDKSCRNQRKRA